MTLQKIESLGLSLASRAELATAPPNSLINWHSLQLQNITHTYYTDKEDNSFILGPINLTLYPQELVFIVGGNGSGKSSLAKLITGLYIPENYSLNLNNKASLITKSFSLNRNISKENN